MGRTACPGERGAVPVPGAQPTVVFLLRLSGAPTARAPAHRRLAPGADAVPVGPAVRDAADIRWPALRLESPAGRFDRPRYGAIRRAAHGQLPPSGRVHGSRARRGRPPPG